MIEADIGEDTRRGVTGSHFPTDEAVDGTTAVSDADVDPAGGAQVQKGEQP